MLTFSLESICILMLKLMENMKICSTSMYKFTVNQDQINQKAATGTIICWMCASKGKLFSDLILD